MNNPERNLFLAVLTVAVRDLCEPDGSPNRGEALAWLGKKRPTQDFVHVVTLLGLDIDATHDSLRTIAAASYAERKAISFKTVENPIRTAERAERKAA